MGWFLASSNPQTLRINYNNLDHKSKFPKSIYNAFSPKNFLSEKITLFNELIPDFTAH